MRSLAIASLSIRGFRNLASVDLDLGAGFNVVWGENGQGKTNLVEAAYVLATSRSFRTSRLSDLVMVGAEVATVRGRILEAAEQRDQSVGLRPGMRTVRVDGVRPETLVAYAMRTPIVVFHPGALSLSAGTGAERRRLLDRVALYVSPATGEEASSYGKAHRARQRVLETKGDDGRDLESWEELMVDHGLALSHGRERAALALVPAAERAFARIGTAGVALQARYERGAPADRDAFLGELKRNRSRDRARRSPTCGPHRDDLGLEIGGHPIRGMASQGQHRAIVLALQLAEIDVLCAVRGVRPVLLLDDVSSELDRARTAALFACLREEQGQVLLTTTRPELIDTALLSGLEDRRGYHVVGGRISGM